MSTQTPRHADEVPPPERAEIPDRHLPPVKYADLPEAKPFGKVIGPSVLLLAGAIGSGEFILWPYITTQVGLALVWLVVIGITTQYFLNMEIERYTLATGETAVTGFTRLWKPWGILFILMTVIPWMWPGWATGGSQALSFVFGFDAGLVPYVSIGILALIGVVLTLSPVVYRTVEKIQFLAVGLIVIFVIYAAVVLIGGEGYGALGRGFVEVGEIWPAARQIEITVLVGAVAFAGAGGAMNLLQSNWVRDKGLGMGERLPKVVSPFTGEEVAAPTTGYFFHRTPENMRRWNAWWRVANREQLITFLLIGGLSLLVFMALAYVTVGVGNSPEGDFAFIRQEGEALGAQYGDWLKVFFWLIGAVVLASTNLTVLDMVGRMVADVLKTGALRENNRWSESRIYLITVWVTIAFGSTILLAGVTQPVQLLVISSAMNGVVMAIVSILLLVLNRRVLPREIGLRGGRMVMIIWSFLFFGTLSAFLVWNVVRTLVG